MADLKEVSLGLKMSLGKTYDQNDSRNEFPDHENIGVYTSSLYVPKCVIYAHFYVFA